MKATAENLKVTKVSIANKMGSYPKKEKKTYQPRFLSDGTANLASSVYAQPTDRQKEQLKITSDTPASWMNADGTKNYEAYNDFLEERERIARATIG